MMRVALAIVVGVLVGAIVAQLGAIVFLLATVGIPLGAQPRELVAYEYVILLAIGACAAAGGAQAAVRIARARGPLVALVLAGLLPLLVLYGFSGPSMWPAWWGSALAGAAGVGAGAVAWWAKVRPRFLVR